MEIAKENEPGLLRNDALRSMEWNDMKVEYPFKGEKALLRSCREVKMSGKRVREITDNRQQMRENS